MKTKKLKVFLILLIISIVLLLLYVLYQTVYLDNKSAIQLTIKGEDTTLELLSSYEEAGAKATFRGKDITDKITTKGTVDTTKVGTYPVTYTVKYKNKKSTVKRNVHVVDTTLPELELVGDQTIKLYVGDVWTDPGVKAIDNYDGDISSKVQVSQAVNTETPGTYPITYTVTDTSGNTASIERAVEVEQKKVIVNHKPGIAVLNYHFFYGDGERCGEGICLHTSKFEEQLKYLKDNGYKTLTMDEFVKWMYGEIELPEKSVLLTIDDGAMGTGAHNGNKLIPLLEKYQAHATLFLVTGWWDISNYQSEYLDVESHTNDMHNEGFCSGVTRGARMLCSSHDVALADLQRSIAVTGSKKAFCYPFYAYNADAINVVKEAGFKVAFAGGGYKATRSSNKYAIPRFPIHSNITLETFINYIS